MLEMSKKSEIYCKIKQTLLTHGKHQLLVSLVTKFTNTFFLLAVSLRNSVNPLYHTVTKKNIYI